MRLRGRFTLWFLLAALVPIATAALVTREVVSRSYRAQFSTQRRSGEKNLRQALDRLEAAVGDSVEAMASRDHYFVGALQLKLDKSQGVVTGEILRWAKERAGPLMRGLGLDVLFALDAGDRILVAPHFRDARGNIDPDLTRRARKLEGRPYYTTEPTIRGDKIQQVLVVEAARSLGSGAHRVTVVAGREIGPALLDVVRTPGKIDARIVDEAGTVLASPAGDWSEVASTPPIRVPLVGPEGQPMAWIEVATSDADLQKLLDEVTLAALVLAGAAMLVTVLLGFFMARQMTRNIDRLVEGAQAASRGELDHRVEIRARDEIGALAEAFNAMMADLKSSKDRLVIAERIAAWQEIARRLAHEIKNPLTPIQMSVETLRKTWQKKHPSFEEAFEESTRTVLEETARLKRILSEFSEFARMPKPRTQPCNLSELVSSALALYEGSVEIERDLAEDLPPIEGDRDQLSQVLLNLIENARDAITLRADGGTDGRILVATQGDPAGAVVLFVEDNGPGIPPEIEEKLFTPYFTTKQEQGGTGLGLAIVHRIVSDHGGGIEVANVAGGGARFTITLPC